MPVFPEYNNFYSASVAQHNDWTHICHLSPVALLDFKSPSNFASITHGHRFQDLVERFFFSLTTALYGTSNFQNHKIIRATCFENRTKEGHLTYWHSHSLLKIEPEFEDRFYAQADRHWKRLTRRQRVTTPTDDDLTFDYVSVSSPPCSMVLQNIEEAVGGIDGAASYICKFVLDSEISPIIVRD